MYKPEDLKTFNGIDVIKKRPDLYFGANGPTPESISTRILEGALILGSNFGVIKRVNEWWFVATDADWLSYECIGSPSVNSLFNGLVSFPEAGVNSIRSEVFANVYSSAVVLGGEAGVQVIKGENIDKELFDQLSISLQPRIRILGFKFDHMKTKT